MPATFGQWLIVILALLVGLAGGWALWGRQRPATGTPIVEGDPVVGLSAEEKAAATIDAPRPDATVDTSPTPVAVVDEPTPQDLTTPQSAGHLAPPADDASLVDDTAAVDRTPAADGTPATIAAERSVPLAVIEDEPTTADLTGHATSGLTGRTTSDETPGSTVADENTAPIPAPRATVEDTPDTPDTPVPATELPEPAPVDGEPAATDPRSAASGPVTGEEALPAPTADTVPTETTPADPSTVPDPAVPTTAPDPEPALTTPTTVPDPDPVAVPDPEPVTPVAVPDPDPATRVADDADEAPAAVAPVIPTQRTSVADNAPVTDSAPVTDRAPVTDSIVAQDAAAGQDGPADDFRRIQGVGPKIAASLQAAGIRTYRQLAELDEVRLRETVRAAGLRAAASLATWPQQAKVLAGAGTEAERVLPVPTGGDTRV